MNEAGDGVRLDKWLWAARFFKTRGLARDAIEGGHVAIGGARAKPGRVVRPGAELDIRRGEEAFTVTVVAVSDRRGPAPQAQLLYEEHADSIARRQARAEQRRLAAEADALAPRPDKKQRRLLRRLKGR